MKIYLNRWVLLILALVFTFIVVRFFPLVVRLFNFGATSVRYFWWIILILALVGWLLYLIRRRRR